MVGGDYEAAAEARTDGGKVSVACESAVDRERVGVRLYGIESSSANAGGAEGDATDRARGGTIDRQRAGGGIGDENVTGDGWHAGGIPTGGIAPGSVAGGAGPNALSGGGGR